MPPEFFNRIGPEPILLERKLTSASGSEVDLMPTGGHFGF